MLNARLRLGVVRGVVGWARRQRTTSAAPGSETSVPSKTSLGRGFAASYIRGGITLPGDAECVGSTFEFAFPDKCYDETGRLQIEAMRDASVKRMVMPTWRRAARRLFDNREWVQTNFVYRKGHTIHVSFDERTRMWRILDVAQQVSPVGWTHEAQYFPVAGDGRQHVMPVPLFEFLKELAIARGRRRDCLHDQEGCDPETPNSVEEARTEGATFQEYIQNSFELPASEDPDEVADGVEIKDNSVDGVISGQQRDPRWIEYQIDDSELPGSMHVTVEDLPSNMGDHKQQCVPEGSDESAEVALDNEADYVRVCTSKRRAEMVMDCRKEQEAGEFGLDESEEVDRFQAIAEGQLAQYLLDVRQTTNQTKSGKVSRYAALVVVGNGRGLVGYAVGKGTEPDVAVDRAYRKAETRMFNVDLDPGGVLPHSVVGNYVKTKVVITLSPWETPVAHEAVHAVLDGAGVKFCTAKIIGSRNVQNVVRATIHGLLQCRSARTRSRETGRYITPKSQSTSNNPAY